MKIFLCEPNIPVKASRFEPLGLCTISAFLKSKGHQVVVYQQFSQSESQVADEVEKWDPDVVGFSCIDISFPGALKMARMVKALLPKALVVFGGEHATANPQLAADPSVDLLVIGEGEITLEKVLEEMAKGGLDFSKINGVAFFDGEKVIQTPPRDRIADLGTLPLPDREILGKSQYRYYGLTPSDLNIPASKLRVSSTYLSRGCAHNCSFCTTPNVWGRRWIARPVDDVIREVEELVKGGINFIYFQDENFLANLEIVAEFCNKKMERGLDVPFSVISRVAHLNEEIVDLLYRAGLKHVGVGIESVREQTLEKIHKGLDLKATKERISMLRRRSISVCGLFMIGYPWETSEMIKGYSPVFSDLGVDSIKIQFLTPFAGTDLYVQAQKEGKILTENPLDNSTESPVLKSEHLSPEELISLRKSLYRGFYFSPGFILKIIRQSIKSPSLIPDYLTRFYWFLKRMAR